jgi:hypothetical protein
MRLIGKYHVRLDDGTSWAVDREDANGSSLEWYLRYGTREELYARRLDIASVLGSFKALLYRPQKRCNQVMRELRDALEEWETQAPSEDGRPKT